MTTPLAALGNVVPDGYAYYEKRTTHAEPLKLADAWLKWYDIFPESDPVTPAQQREARDFLAGLAAERKLHLEHDLGFVILHRAGAVLLLILTTWRQTNEMWESVFYKRADDSAGYAPVPQKTSHKATYCVWELGAVWHERNAWVRFLASARDEAAKREWLGDRFSGMV